MSDEEHRVTAGQRIGDVAMLVFKLPVYTAVLAVLLAITAMVLMSLLGFAELSSSTMIALFLFSLLPAAPLAWLAAADGRYWRIVLQKQGVLFAGPGGRRYLPYSEVRLLRIDSSRSVTGEKSPEGDRLGLRGVVGKALGIYLPAKQAAEVFALLRKRCAHAAAIDADGAAYPARKDRGGVAAQQAMRTLRVRGVGWIISAALTLLLVLLGDAGADDALEAVRLTALRGLGLVYGMGGLAFGLRLLVQAGRLKGGQATGDK